MAFEFRSEAVERSRCAGPAVVSDVQARQVPPAPFLDVRSPLER